MYKKRMLEYTSKTFTPLLPSASETLQADIEAYLEKQLDYCTDLNFARYFPWKELERPLSFFLQHVIQSQGEYYLAGPRFFGGNIQKPFIQVLASTGPLTQTAANAIIARWAALETRTLQILRHIDEPLLGSIDQYIYVATVEDMAKRIDQKGNTGKKEPQEAINVRPAAIQDLEACMNIITESFTESHTRFPALKERVTPCTREEIKEGIGSGEVFLIESSLATFDQHPRLAPVGLIYLASGGEAFLNGYMMIEECVTPQARGYGLAAQAQIEIARKIALKRPSALVMGTIDALNIASQKTAMHAGRTPLLRYEFVTPEQLAGV